MNIHQRRHYTSLKKDTADHLVLASSFLSGRTSPLADFTVIPEGLLSYNQAIKALATSTHHLRNSEGLAVLLLKPLETYCKYHATIQTSQDKHPSVKTVRKPVMLFSLFQNKRLNNSSKCMTLFKKKLAEHLTEPVHTTIL
jgi:hypothetical protein